MTGIIYVALGVLAPLLWAVGNLIDRKVTQSWNIYNFAALWTSLSAAVGFAGMILLPGTLPIRASLPVLVSVLSGLAYALGVLFYFYAMERGEADQNVLLMKWGAVLTLVLENIYIQAFSYRQLLAFFILFSGGLMAVERKDLNLDISLKRHEIWMIVATFFFALTAFFRRYAVLELSYTAVFLIANASLSLFIPFFIYRADLGDLNAVKAGFAGLSSTFGLTASFVIHIAVSYGPAAILTVIGNIQTVFVFLIAWFLTYTGIMEFDLWKGEVLWFRLVSLVALVLGVAVLLI